MEKKGSETIRFLAVGWGALVVGLLVPGSLAASDAGRSDAANAGQGSAQLDASLEQTLVAPDDPRAGDPLALKLEVAHPAGADVRVDPTLENSRWSLLEKRSGTAGGERRSTTTVTMNFQVFRPGSATLDPFEVVVSTSGDRSSGLQTEPVSVRIRSVLENSDDPEFRAAPDPHPVWTRDYTLAWVGGGVAAALAVGLFALALFRRGGDTRMDPSPSVPPEPEALERLETLQESDLLERGDFMVLYVRLSETIRRYLGRRFGFPGTEWTTAEILEALEESVWRGDVEFDEIAAWMHRVDRVKFSGIVPPADEAEGALERAFDIVRETEPPPTDSTDDGDDSEHPPSDAESVDDTSAAEMQSTPTGPDGDDPQTDDRAADVDGPAGTPDENGTDAKDPPS